MVDIKIIKEETSSTFITGLTTRDYETHSNWTTISSYDPENNFKEIKINDHIY